jgi:hypothetical protein
MTRKPVELGAVTQDGRVYLDAQHLIRALRDRAAHWDRMAEDEEQMAGWDPERYQTACWTAAVELQDRANDLDLYCIERISEEKDEHGN